MRPWLNPPTQLLTGRSTVAPSAVRRYRRGLAFACGNGAASSPEGELPVYR
jgi:hypothetical protein